MVNNSTKAIVVRDMGRTTKSVTSNGIKNVNYNYSITNRQGIIKKCKTTYDKSFDR